MKILLAIDGSTCSDHAVSEVARRPWPAGSEVKIITVIETPIVPGAEPWALPETYFEDLEKESRRYAHSGVESAASKIRAGEDKSLRVTTEVFQGSAKGAIVEIAESWGADLIVVGSHGYSALHRFLIGSVSNAVALHAKCSVEIVRCPPKHDT